MPVLVAGRAPTTSGSPPSASGWPGALPDAVLSLVPGAGHAAHLRTAGTWHGPAGRRHFLGTGLTRSQQDPDGQQHADRQLQPPVAPSTGSSSRPSARPEHGAYRARRPAAGPAGPAGPTGGPGHQARSRPPRRPATRRRASRPAGGPGGRPGSACPTTTSPAMSRRLLATSRAVASRPTAMEAHSGRSRRRTAAGQPSQVAELHVGRADRGHQAEEDEDEQLAEPEVAVGLGAAGVEPAGREAGRPDGHQPPGGGRGQGQAGHGRPPRSDRTTPRCTAAGASQPGGDQAQRARPAARRCPGPRRSSRWRSWSRPGRPGPRPGRRPPATR